MDQLKLKIGIGVVAAGTLVGASALLITVGDGTSHSSSTRTPFNGSAAHFDTSDPSADASPSPSPSTDTKQDGFATFRPHGTKVDPSVVGTPLNTFDTDQHCLNFALHQAVAENPGRVILCAPTTLQDTPSFTAYSFAKK